MELELSKRQRGLLWVVLGVLLVGSFGFLYWSTEVREKEFVAGLSTADSAHIELMKQELARVEINDLLVMRDSSIYLATSHYYGSSLNAMSKSGQAVELEFYFAGAFFALVRIVKPTDPEYPLTAARFIRREPPRRSR
jgi:hypothetical protein